MVRVVALVLLLAACPKKDEPKTLEPVAIAVPVMAIDAAVAEPVPSTRIDAAIATDAKRIVEGEYATQVERFLQAYLDLLWADIHLTEMLVAYPGAPKTDRYNSYSHAWRLPDRDKIEKALQRASATSTHSLSNEESETDRAVSAYTKEAALAWPRLRVLADYYAEKRFVDDEFALGRRDAPFVAETLAKLRPLRAPMINAVFAGWREAAGDKTESPRAIISASFEACMRAAYVIFGRTTHADPKRQEEADRAMDVPMSACRKGVGAVSALPGEYRSFEVPLRAAAVAFGDSMTVDWGRKYAVDDVERLVRSYIERWPKLPSEPAERPSEKVE